MAKQYSIYRNLNKPGFFSIRQSGLVVEYGHSIRVQGNIGFHVGEKSRLRVIRDRRKNVHSWIKADEYQILDAAPALENYHELWFDPYFTQHYYCVKTGGKLMSAVEVVFANNRAYALHPQYLIL